MEQRTNEYNKLSKYITNFIVSYKSRSNNTIFVKGIEKKKRLKKLIQNLYINDLFEEGCSSFRNLKINPESYNSNEHLFTNDLNCVL